MKIQKYTNEEFIKICNDCQTMAQAAVIIGMHFNTFKRKAVKLNCYKPNEAGKGIKKPILDNRKYDLQSILKGDYPEYQTFKLKNRLLCEGIKENICESCGQNGTWNSLDLRMELDHIDGDRTNHRLENLRMICPNCHSQTETYRSKNRYKNGPLAQLVEARNLKFLKV